MCMYELNVFPVHLFINYFVLIMYFLKTDDFARTTA